MFIIACSTRNPLIWLIHKFEAATCSARGKISSSDLQSSFPMMPIFQGYGLLSA